MSASGKVRCNPSGIIHAPKAQLLAFAYGANMPLASTAHSLMDNAVVLTTDQLVSRLSAEDLFTNIAVAQRQELMQKDVDIAAFGSSPRNRKERRALLARRR